MTRWRDRTPNEKLGFVLASVVAAVALAVVMLFVLVVGLSFFGILVFEVPWALVSGMWSYPAFVLPRVRPNGFAILTSAFAFAATAAGVHATGRWIRTSRGATATPWTGRWTAAILAAFVLTFGIAVDIAAIVHQSAWLANAPPKSLVYDTWRDGPEPITGPLCAYASRTRSDGIDEVRTWQSSERYRRRVELWEIEIIRRADRSAGGVIARPRDPRSPFAGRIFTCAGEMNDTDAAKYAADIEAQTAAPATH